MNDDDWKDRAQPMISKLRESKVYAGIVTDSFLKDPTCALQLGCAILLNKPIALIVDKSCKIPDSLIKVAKVIQYVDTKCDADVQKAAEAIKEMIK